MSPPKVMGAELGDEGGESPLRRIRASIDMLSNRIGKVEAQVAEIPELVRGQEETNKYLATIKGYEATLRGLVSRGVLLLLSAVGGTYGVTRATQPPATVEKVQIQTSATTAKVDALKAMQPGPERDRKALELLGELMGPGR